MENFAIDLDKVLDDFELNEDESESASHYDKLQLEFRRENSVPVSGVVSNAHLPVLGIAAGGSWNEALPDLPTEDRGLPDGQHADENVVPVCAGAPIPVSAESSVPFRPSLSPNIQNDENVRFEDCGKYANPCQKPDVASEVSGKSDSEKLWPNLHNQRNVLLVEPTVSSSSVAQASKDDNSSSHSRVCNLPYLAGGFDALPSSQSCNLDVLPPNVPSSSGYSVWSSHEGQHPDILDVRQDSPDAVPFCDSRSFHDHPPLRNELPENLTDQEESVPVPSDLQREAILLPDLMPTNDNERNGASLDLSNMHEVSNPAVVTDNSLSALNINTNEPAIVQESQSNSRIPEVVNVHQTAEQCSSSGWFEGNAPCSAVDINVRAESSHADHVLHTIEPNDCDTFDKSPSEGVSPILPDVSASCENVLIPAIPCELEKRPDIEQNQEESESNEPPSVVRFNPCANVDEEELDAELEELEEEQARLHGAYSGSGFQLQETPRSETPEVAGASNPSQSPDLIEGIETASVEQNAACSVLASVAQDAACSILNTETNPTDDCKDDEPSSFESQEKEENVGDTVDVSVGSVSENQPEASSVASAECDTEENAAGVDEGENLQREEVGEEHSESTATDTLSSSSTITEGESLSPEHIAVPIPEEQPSPSSLPDSPSRETPGALVTAVYDDSRSEGGHLGGGNADGDNGLNGVGAVAPFWVPDTEAPNCQECGIKFTVLKRRHHCRGCGRVLCSTCCHFKAPLPYMDFKEARVCATCLHLISEAAERVDQSGSNQPGHSPNPNNPMEYCSRIPPQQQVGVSGSGPPPSVMVPVGVLKRENSEPGNGSSSSRTRASKQVIFSDGIRPGGDLTEQGGQTRPAFPYRKVGRNTRRVTPEVPEYVFDTSPDSGKLEEQMKGDGEPVVFALQKNLTVLVKQIKLDCCVGVQVWNVATRGLCNVGQEELVVLLEVNPGETSPPPHLFSFLHTVYQQANKGNFVSELGHTIFSEPEGFLGSKEHGGFLYIRPTYQCLNKLVLPPPPYLFAVLIQKWETPWAKVFPLRLMLRLGAEFRYYPCPLVSTRNRKSVYCEIGHTIMNLLVDFRNYTYTLPVIQGFVIHMEDKKTTLLIPRNRYEQVWKALNNSNDHVLALGANFSPQSDSHLVTVEDDDGHYTTQAINIHSKPRKVTGASFIVFNGALKSNSGLKAKSSIVEDGLMVQISGEMMNSLRDSLRNMKDFNIPCGPVMSQPDELVSVRWVQDDKNFNIGVKSPIDGRPMDGVPSVKIHSGTDYVSQDHLIRWTEVFIIQGEPTTSNNDINISRLAESLARACCVALTPHLALLYVNGPNRLALRATIHQDNVGYESGIGGSKLLPLCMNDLDEELIPVIHRAAASITEEPIVLELLFHIMEQ